MIGRRSPAEPALPRAAATTAQVRRQIARLDSLIREIERKPDHRQLAWTWMLEDLRDERTALQLLLRTRRVEGAKKIVDLRRWRDGGSRLLRSPAEPSLPFAGEKA